MAGVDDWAFPRNHRYGTLLGDLERREVVALLPDRELATVAAWLADHPSIEPSIEILSRDRGGGYGEATTKALPRAVQMADRWHLMENGSVVFLDAVRKSMRTIRAAIGATVADPELLTCAERLQYQGYLPREETNDNPHEALRGAYIVSSAIDSRKRPSRRQNPLGSNLKLALPAWS